MKNEITDVDTTLRQKAEKLLKKKATKKVETQLSEADSLKLIHELDVYQIELDMQTDEFQQSKLYDAERLALIHQLEAHHVELEMQNHELSLARVKAEKIAKNYSTLYDFAPTGYFTLSVDGEILELNLCGAQMLGKERSNLLNSRFAFFVSNNTKPFFQLFLDKVFITNKTETCEITIKTDGNPSIYAHVTGLISENKDQCLLTVVDITKRKKAEEELLLKNVIFDSSIAANSIADIDGIIIEVNNSFYLGWGYKSKYEVIGKSIASFFAYSSEAEQIMNSLNETGQWEGEFIAKRVDNSHFFAYATATVVRDKYDKIIGYQSSVIDNTNQKIAEEALKVSEEKFRGIFENTKDIFFQISLDGKIIDISPSVKSLTNISREEFIGKSFIDSHNNPLKTKLLFDSVINNVDLTDFEIEVKSKNGHSKFLSINAILIVDQLGNKKHIDGSIRDVTERKLAEDALTESEENYRFMFANNPQPMWIYDLETLVILEVNQSAICHYGYSREEFLSMTLKDLRPKEDFPALMRDLELAKADNNTVTQWRHIKKNKESIFVEVIAHSVKYNGRNARHVLINDITERKQVEFKLVNTQEELKKFAAHLQNIREEERIMLARDIHDELAQILIAIKMDMGLIKQKLSRGLNSICNEELMENFNHVFGLVDNTIHTSRKIMSGLRSEMLELLGLIETIKIYTKEYEGRHYIKCNMMIESNEVEFDPHKSVTLLRIYQEILTNVVKHAEATELNIYLTVKSKILIMEVKDNGRGFDKTTENKPNTYGIIGMKERTFLLDGKLSIETEPGKGTTVKVEIPY
ncbi:MAG: PAS domain S-box protein [Paludibacter sp.]